MDDSDEHHDDGCDEQQMYESSYRVDSNNSEEPKDEKDNRNGYEHKVRDYSSL